MNLHGSVSRCRFWVSRVSHYSTGIGTGTGTSTVWNHPLVRRILPLGDPRVSITPVLNQWVEEGEPVSVSKLNEIIKLLRKHGRFTHALQVSEWMSDKKNHNLSPADIAIRLDLILKVHGLEQAEKYFDGIPNDLRVSKVYGALLNCYAYKKSLEKAEIIMQKIKGCLNPLNYNVMLNLYSKMGKHEKFGALVQEMEEKGINPSSYTYNIQLNAYAASSNLEAMEKLLMKMEIDPLVTMDWETYFVTAKGYLKAGLTEKAVLMLKKMERCMNFQSRRLVYEILLTIYSDMGNKDEVQRIWNMYKSFGRFYNSGSRCMIRSLAKLDDMDGAERVFAEWESGYSSFDVRVPNMLLGAYCKKGLLVKAEALVNKLIESGKKPETSTWDLLATGYRFDGQMEKAVETLKKAMLATGAKQYIPNQFTLVACNKYLEGKGDMEAAEELLRLLKEQCRMRTNSYNKLVNFIINSENPIPATGDLIKQDDHA